MNFRTPHIAREQWLRYTDNATPEDELRSLEAHMDLCGSCGDIRARVMQAQERLAQAGKTTNAAVYAGEGSLTRVWDNVRFRIRRSLRAPAQEPASLAQLRSILISMFGSAAADGALNTARISSEAGHGERFACNLGSLVEVMCGDKAGDLVRHAARHAERGRAA